MQHEIWNFGGQLYARVESRFHKARDGTLAEMSVWQTHCADCGVLFEVTTLEKVPRYITRRCSQHAAKGRKVKAHILWGKQVPLAELLGERPMEESAKSGKRTGGGDDLGGSGTATLTTSSLERK
ncbi:hypothetical protein [Magnetococcus marinus]|uniref:hypothetical protein n=1 Tax=Magnetococcus marinus TaxID=1124597 RepID=UPI00059F62EB|nr:hypothetical protein [Magnetococcus marinus]